MKMTIVIENKTVIITDDTPPIFIKKVLSVMKSRHQENE